MIINMWLGITEDYRNEILEYLAWDENTQGPYPGPLVAVDEAIFDTVADVVTVQALYRVDKFQGKDWYVFSIYIPEPGVDDVVDWLADNKGSKTKILGAWEYDSGLQYGTELDEGVIIGTPTYPLNSRLLEFMPTIKVYDHTGNLDNQAGGLISEDDPTVNTDVNILQGQAARSFT